jgi:hypothetical protein
MRYIKFLLILAIPFFSISCTKTRDPKLPEKLEASLFDIKQLESLEFRLNLSQPDFATKTQKPTKDGTKKNYQPIDNDFEKTVSSHNASEKMSFLFRNLKLRQNENELLVKLKVSKDYLTAFRVVKQSSKKEKISEIKQTLAKKIGDNLWIPIFQFKIDDYGTVQQSVDSSGHKTLVLELRKSDWTVATHVVIDPRPENRMMVDLASQPAEQIEEIFSLEKINNRIFTRQELHDLFNFDFSMLALYPLETEFLVRINGSQLQVKLMISPSSSWLTDIEKKNIKRYEVCNSKAVLDANIGHGVIAADCILLDRGVIDIAYINPRLKKTSDNADFTHEVEFERVPSTSNTNFIKIDKNQIIKPKDLPQEFNDLIAIKNIDKMEFLFRRTVEDASNSLILEPGNSGVTEIVKFVLNNDKVALRRVDTLLSSSYTREVDTEELMVLPVKYFQLTKRDDKGSLLSVPQLISTTKENAEFVKIDFQHNKIPISSSPLMYLEGGACFSTINSADIKDEDLDNKLNEGILNFSYSYSVSLVPDCLSDYPTVSNYWETALQTTHNMKERVSIVRFIPHTDPNYQMPFYAQRKLNFGAFTIANRKYDQFGHYGADGTEAAYPLIHDIRNGKKIIYTLGGLSPNNPRRDQIIRASKEVVSEWNMTLKKALQGSNLERGEDIIELKIEGVDAELGHLGDLNKNYIWIIEKQLESGPIGLAQPAANPRAGYIEAANVLIYESALLNLIGDFYKDQEKYRKHDEFIAKLLTKSKANIDAENAEVVSDSTDANKEISSSSGTAQIITNLTLTNGLTVSSDLPKAQEKKITATKEFFEAIASTEKTSASAQMSLAPVSRNDFKTLIHNKSSLPYVELARNKVTNKSFISEVYSRISKDNAWENDEEIEIIANEVFLNQNKQTLSVEQSNRLTNQITKMKLKNHLKKNILSSSPSCSIEISKDLLNQSIFTTADDLYYNSLKYVLAHEMGHSLGLTHNFIASTDKLNFEDRAYSSVMDYAYPSLFQYKGPGSYDVHALRAIYSQRLEKQDGKIISLDDILKESHSKSWTEFMKLSDDKLTDLNLKPYQYCSDRDVGANLKCQVWDSGTTATEITQNNIKKHMKFYQFANGAEDKLNFTWLGTGRYIKLLIRQLRPLRQVLNEYFVRILEDTDEDSLDDYREATTLAYKYFLSIVGTPDTDKPFESEERFSVMSQKVSTEEIKSIDSQYTYTVKELKKGDNGTSTVIESPVSLHVVEAKSMQDQFVSATDYRLNTRGYFYDKAFAQLLLASRQSLVSRFRPSSNSSVEVSFVEFEKIAEIKNPMILDSILDTLKGRVKPSMFDFHGGLVLLPTDDYKTASSALTTSAAIENAIFGLAPSSADNLSGVNNYLFRVGAHEGSHPEGLLSINRLEEVKNSNSGYHYYQTSGATLSNQIIEDLYMKRECLEAPEDLLQIIANGATQILDLAIDFDGNGQLKVAVLKEKLSDLYKKYPANQKLSAVIQYFDKNAERYQNFLVQSRFSPKQVEVARKGLESLSGMAAMDLYANFDQIFKANELRLRIKKITNDQNNQSEKEELEKQLEKIDKQIKVSQRMTLDYESVIPQFILSRKALNLMLSNSAEINRVLDTIQRNHFKDFFVQAGADIWVNEFRAKNPEATREVTATALQKNEENTLYMMGKNSVDQKRSAEYEAGLNGMRASVLSEYLELARAYAQDTKRFKTEWNLQFKKVQQLSNLFQLYTIEAQK